MDINESRRVKFKGQKEETDKEKGGVREWTKSGGVRPINQMERKG